MYKLYSQIWYVVIRVLLDTSSRYKVVGRTDPCNGESKNVLCGGKTVAFFACYWMDFFLRRPKSSIDTTVLGTLPVTSGQILYKCS